MIKRTNRGLMSVAIMIVLIGTGSAWADLTDGLVAHWTFDGDANDSAGSNDGTLMGDPQWVTGQIGGALEFDGINDYVDVSDDDSLTLTDITLTAWVKSNDKSDYKHIISNYHIHSSAQFYHLYIEAGTGKGRFQIDDGSGTPLYVVGTTDITDGQWHHIAGVRDAASDLLRVYVDGIHENSISDTTAPVAINPMNDLWIGGQYHFSSRYFNGLIDDVRIYDRALSAGEVRQLYDGGELLGLEIEGPNEVAENSNTSYKAIAVYDNNSTADVTALADWSVEPNDNCGITAGLLTTEPIDLPEDITIYAEYTEDGNTVAAEKEVEVFVIDNCLWPRVPYDPDPCDGAVGVPIDTNLVWNGGGDDCSASCSLGNGGFEEGIFGPWVAVTGFGDELTPWNVTEGRTGYFHNGEPFEGRFFAQNGFDGEAGLYYELYQEIHIPDCATTAILRWSERIQWDLVRWGATIPREYEVSVQPAGGGAPLAILYSRLLQPGTSGDTGYVAHSVDLLNGAAGIAGQTVRINFHEYIPETMTGPAQFDLDGISLSCDGDVLLGGVPTVNTSLAISQLSESSTVDFEVLKAEYDHIRSDALTALVEKSASYNFGDSSLPNSIEDDTQMTSAVSSFVISSISGQIVNGDFETGDFSGWTLMDSDTRWLGTFVINDGTYNPHSPDGPFPPYNGSFSALSDQDGPGIYSIYQDVTLPADATSAILYWVDKIRNHHNRFEDPDQEFRVERWNTNNQVLSTLFSTNPGDPLLSGWTTHSVDISDFIGMTIRIAFTEEAQRFFFNVHLDDIRIELNGGGPSYPEVYDVYFGTEDPPLELIAGDMNEPMFYPGLLDCNTMYYWQVVAKNSCGNTPGPVWSFTTISCPALVNEVIGEKLEMLERISVLLEKELVAYKGFEELLASGDYGDLDKGDIVKAKQKIHSAMQHEEQAADALEKSLEKLNDALDALDIEPNGNGL